MVHIQGTMALVESHGLDSLSGPIAWKLTIRMTITLTISCAAAICPIPDELMSLRKRLDYFVSDVKWGFTALLVDVVNLRANIHNVRFTCAAEALSGLEKSKINSFAWKLQCPGLVTQNFYILSETTPLFSTTTANSIRITL